MYAVGQEGAVEYGEKTSEFWRCRCSLQTAPETMDQAMSSHPLCKKTSDKSIEE